MNELHDAARTASIELTLALLARGSIGIDSVTGQDLTPLTLSVLFGHSSVANILLNKGASVSMKDNEGHTALHFAAYKGDRSATKLLVRAGAAVDAREVNRFEPTPLHMAASQGHVEVMRVLIEAGTNPNSRTSKGMTPLCFAAMEGYVDAVRELLLCQSESVVDWRMWSS